MAQLFFHLVLVNDLIVHWYISMRLRFRCGFLFFSFLVQILIQTQSVVVSVLSNERMKSTHVNSLWYHFSLVLTARMSIQLSWVCISSACFVCLLNWAFSNRDFDVLFIHNLYHLHTHTHTHNVSLSHFSPTANNKESYFMLTLISCTEFVYESNIPPSTLINQFQNVSYGTTIGERELSNEQTKNEINTSEIFYFHCIWLYYLFIM